MIVLNGRAITLEGRKVGFLSNDEEGRTWYVSPRKRHLHYFRIHRGWGVAQEILDYIENVGAYGVALVIDQKEILRSSIAVLRQEGTKVQYDGFEPQIIMPESKWLKEQRML